MSLPLPTPKFAHPPVVETILGLQFEPLLKFRSHHFGWFWTERLKLSGWEPVGDERPLPIYAERFGDARLRLTGTMPASGVPALRMKCRNLGRSLVLQIQPDKLYLTWGRSGPETPSYSDIRPVLDELVVQFEGFAADSGLGEGVANLWEVCYINRVPRGELWNEPKDWHRVLPKLFPQQGPDCAGLPFTTYDGTWHFEIEPKRGRIHVQVAKMLVNQEPEPVLFLRLTARGELATGVSWRSAMDVGHDSCVQLFAEITSAEAKRSWGMTQ